MNSEIKVSKLDAAKRQSETAIVLYFSYGDPISIHTLVAASHNILRDINLKRGSPRTTIKDRIMERVKPGFEGEVRKLINQADNFFKHADRDYNEVLDFDPAPTEYLLLDCCAIYQSLTGEHPPIHRTFIGWFSAHHQALFNYSEQDRITDIARSERVMAMSKKAYFDMALPILTRGST